MTKKSFLLLMSTMIAMKGFAKTEGANFTDAESNFKLVMQDLVNKYVDKNISKDELYQAATAGMLSSLNTGDETWNKLMTPQELKDMEEDLSGRITGIGATIKWDESTGYGKILKVIQGSPAEKAGLRPDDQILSVAGKKFKGQTLADMVNVIRGEVGKSVEIKILREDQILNFKVQRQSISWASVDLDFIEKTAVLSINYFNEQTPTLVEERLKEIHDKGIHKLVIDVRGNQGGGFEQAIKTAGYFLPEHTLVVSTEARNGQFKKYYSQSALLASDVKIVLITNKQTFCGGELFVAALKENRSVKIVGEPTFGKWNVQNVETLPNHFAIKYTIQKFQSSHGNSYQGIGIKPDIEVNLPKDIDINELRAKMDSAKRLNADAQLKAAVEFIKSI